MFVGNLIKGILMFIYTLFFSLPNWFARRLECKHKMSTGAASIAIISTMYLLIECSLSQQFSDDCYIWGGVTDSKLPFCNSMLITFGLYKFCQEKINITDTGYFAVLPPIPSLKKKCGQNTFVGTSMFYNRAKCGFICGAFNVTSVDALIMKAGLNGTKAAQELHNVTAEIGMSIMERMPESFIFIDEFNRFYREKEMELANSTNVPTITRRPTLAPTSSTTVRTQVTGTSTSTTQQPSDGVSIKPTTRKLSGVDFADDDNDGTINEEDEDEMDNEEDSDALGNYLTKSRLRSLFEYGTKPEEGCTINSQVVWTRDKLSKSKYPDKMMMDGGKFRAWPEGSDTRDSLETFTDFKIGCYLRGATVVDNFLLLWFIFHSRAANDIEISIKQGDLDAKFWSEHSCTNECACFATAGYLFKLGRDTRIDLSFDNNHRRLSFGKAFFDKICTPKTTIFKTEAIQFQVEPMLADSSICINGSIVAGNVASDHKTGCSYFSRETFHARCPKSDAFTSECTADLLDITGKFGNFNVKTARKSFIDYPSKGMIVRENCDKSCTVSVDLAPSQVIICNGVKPLIVNMPIKIESDCEWWISNVSPRFAQPICRIGKGRAWILALTIWPFVGMPIVIVLCVLSSYMLLCCWKPYSAAQRRMHKVSIKCSSCEDSVVYEEMEKRHLQCEDGTCPYCLANVGNANLPMHVRLCMSKYPMLERVENEVNSALATPRRSVYKIHNGLWDYSIWWIFYAFVFVLLLICSIVSADEDMDFMPKLPTSSISDVRMDSLFECPIECSYSSEKRCGCGKDKDRSSLDFRREIDESNFLKELSSNAMAVLPANIALTESQSERVLSMSVMDRETTDDKIIVTAKALIDLPLEDYTGVTYEIKDKESLETSRLTIAVLDTHQIYSFRFRYWTTDRTVKGSLDASCFGDCPCSCRTPMCAVQCLEDCYYGGCNTNSCAMVKAQGRCCCKMEIDSVMQNHLWGVWESEYKGTDSIICMKFADQAYSCFLAGEGRSITYGKVNVQVTTTLAVGDKLPERIVTTFEGSQSTMVLGTPKHILLNPEICRGSLCKHGQLGDIQFHNIKLLKYPRSEEYKGGIDWSTVHAENFCGQSWNDRWCDFKGMVKDNSKTFNDVISTSRLINDTFNVYKSTVYQTGDNIPVLDMSIRPKRLAGIIQLSVEIGGVELSRRVEKPVVKQFSIVECSGCQGCLTGGSCQIEIELSEPEKFNLHVKSCSDTFIVQSDTLPASTLKQKVNITFSSQLKLDKVCMCIAETNTCSETTKITQWEATKASIPSSGIIAAGSVGTRQEAGELKGFTAFFNGVGRVFKGMWGMFSSIFSSWETILTVIIIFVVVVVLYKLGIIKLIINLVKACWGEKKVQLSNKYKRSKEAVKTKLKEKAESVSESFQSRMKRMREKKGDVESRGASEVKKQT